MKVCVIGLGYIGFPTACLMAKAGHNVVGVDISEERVESINNGSFLLNEPGFKELFDSAKKNLVAKTSPQKADVFVICVPTPLKKDKTPDNSYVESAANAIAPLVETASASIVSSISYMLSAAILAVPTAAFLTNSLRFMIEFLLLPVNLNVHILLFNAYKTKIISKIMK